MFAWAECARYGIVSTREWIDRIWFPYTRYTDNYEFKESSKLCRQTKCPYFQCSFISLRRLNCLLSFGAHTGIHCRGSNREAWGSRSRTPTAFFLFSFVRSCFMSRLYACICAKNCCRTRSHVSILIWILVVVVFSFALLCVAPCLGCSRFVLLITRVNIECVGNSALD